MKRRLPGVRSVTRAKDAALDRLARSVVSRAGPELAAQRLVHHTVFGHPDRLTLAATAVVNNAVFNTVSGDIVVEDWVMMAHGVYLASGEHEMTKFNYERQVTTDYYGWDIIVEEGAWLATNVTVLGPCRIGRHAVVAAGSLVRRDVAPFAIVAGVPARQVGTVPHPPEME